VSSPTRSAADVSALASVRLSLADGEMLSLGDLLARGPVLLDFWATWCKPCVASVPALQSLYDRLRDDGFTVVGISVDGPRNFSKVRPFVTRMGITYPIAIDRDGSLQRFFQVTAVPTTILLDADGRIAAVTQGYRPGEEKEMEAAVRALLPAPARRGDGASGGGR
jgi:peroxiredoxin